MHNMVSRAKQVTILCVLTIIMLILRTSLVLEFDFLENDFRSAQVRFLELDQINSLATTGFETVNGRPVGGSKLNINYDSKKRSQKIYRPIASKRTDNISVDMPENLYLDLKIYNNKKLHKKLDFIIDEPTTCQANENIFLLNVILTAPRFVDSRNAIRKAWADVKVVKGRNIKSVFFMGKPTTANLVQKMAPRVNSESERYRDIIQAVALEENIVSSPTVFKMLSVFKWVVSWCPHATYILISTDSLFVNYENILKAIDENAGVNKRYLYMGRVKKYSKVDRTPGHPEYISKAVYNNSNLPKYCVGGAGVVLSSAFVHRAYDDAMCHSFKPLRFPSGDMYLGIQAKRLRVEAIYQEEFLRAGFEADYCDLKHSMTLGGFLTPTSISEIWKNFTTPIDHCPSANPNNSDISEWSRGVDNSKYFSKCLNIIYNNPSLCNRTPYLVAFITSFPDHFALRDAIRVTWGAPEYVSKLNIRVMFVLGRAIEKETPELINRITQEHEKYNDILLANFAESFHNLTLKVVLGLKWINEFCPDVKFIYKGDDDMLVNFDRILGHLRSHYNSTGLFLGNLMSSSPVIRQSSKYLVSRKVYPFKYFPPYFSGGGYIMSSDIIPDLYKQSLSTKLIPIDDAFCGILAKRAGITLTGTSGFISSGSKDDMCRLHKAYNLHGFKTTSTMIERWYQFRNTSTQKTCK
ncbi:uncharacterized protein LOC117105760 [Anneissia japonica]|uniref:uncharacterized protein LOC117105760 n=1 Tax=Anneissia japonica TaxID=1529436 RepID=UPI001425768F|nr:uncharacterized protein LOC117105760 [Anneissia japonica]